MHIHHWFPATALMLALAACGTGPLTSRADLPAATPSVPGETADTIVLHAPGHQSPLICTRTVWITVGGNPYAQPEDLEDGLREKAVELGTTTVFLQPDPPERAMITGGPAHPRLGATDHTPRLSGIACRPYGVHTGFQVDWNWRVERVFAGSPAEGSGIQEGDQVLSLDRIYFPSSPRGWDRALASKKPGDTLHVEYVNRRGDIMVRAVDLISVDCLLRPKSSRAC